MLASLLLFFRIVYDVIVPIFLMMGVGFLVQKKLGFDIRSLTRLNFWIFVPAFLFVRFVESDLSGGQLLSITIHFALLFGISYGVTWFVARACGYSNGLCRAMTASVLFYNSGNYGVPVAQLALGGAGATIQAFIIPLQNFSNFTIGLALHAGGSGLSRREQFGAMLKLPMLYVFIAAILSRTFSLPMPAPLNTALHYIADGMVPLALVTLGAQMGTLESYRITTPMAITLFLRLAFAPLVAFFIVYAMGLTGVLAQAVIVSSSFPTAVNSALLAIEYNNEPDYSAAVVFYTTLFSAVSVPAVILATKLLIR